MYIFGYVHLPHLENEWRKLWILTNAAMVLGIISVLSTILMTIYIPMILGTIAIVLALLSKGLQSHMAGQAMTGMVCGIGGLLMNLGILISSLMFIFSHPEILQDAARTYDTQFEIISLASLWRTG